MVTVTFFRGALHDLYHCHGLTPIPDCLARLVPKTAEFGLLSLDYRTRDAHLSYVDQPSIDRPHQWFRVPVRHNPDLFDRYEELNLDTELEPSGEST